MLTIADRNTAAMVIRDQITHFKEAYKTLTKEFNNPDDPDLASSESVDSERHPSLGTGKQCSLFRLHACRY